MSGFRIARDIRPDPTPKAKAVKSKGYLSFIRLLPCCVTGQYGVEAAHLSFANTQYGHYGRGRGTKVSDRWALPLSPASHREQHSGNEEFWWGMFHTNPHVLALTLSGLWNELGDEAEPFCTAIIMAGLNRRDA